MVQIIGISQIITLVTMVMKGNLYFKGCQTFEGFEPSNLCLSSNRFISYDWVLPYLMHAISKFANIITHRYNVCRLKRNEN